MVDDDTSLSEWEDWTQPAVRGTKNINEGKVKW